ncbi:hypothetical protein [Solidesulfovibrio carbinolicus]|uniref:hypothetical protein n=1 Tax=Solidesulfovibrio carbinolicus TaxID=296842 RepID=UPI0010105DF3|nr:hypothetical protein [Solidesulfovibrio carbinolicus]
MNTKTKMLVDSVANLLKLHSKDEIRQIESKIGIADKALKNLETNYEIPDRIIVKSMFDKIVSLKAQGVPYSAIYDSLNLKISLSTFLNCIRRIKIEIEVEEKWRAKND